MVVTADLFAEASVLGALNKLITLELSIGRVADIPKHEC
jgi:hypothetical protein